MILSMSFIDWTLLSKKYIIYKVVNGINKPNDSAVMITRINFGLVGLLLPSAKSIIFALGAVTASEIAFSSLFCNRNKYKVSIICC